jgi:glycine/D-amino acid oxidase-like deaminating enzyme
MAWKRRNLARLIAVGSGVVGASCAYTASRLGAEVVLADAALPGGATAAGAGIICPWSSRVDDPVWYGFACPSAREYPRPIAELAELGEAEVGYRQAGRPTARPLPRQCGGRGAVVRAGTVQLVCRSGRAVGVLLDGQLIEADADSRAVAGATRGTGSGFDYRVTPGGLAEVLEHALAVAPGLAAGSYQETRVGFRPLGPDIRPLLGPVGGVEQLVVATGLGASGLTMGPTPVPSPRGRRWACRRPSTWRPSSRCGHRQHQHTEPAPALRASQRLPTRRQFRRTRTRC